MVNDSFQIRIQIQPISSGAVIHSETWHLCQKCIRICKKHGIFVHGLHLFRQHGQSTTACTGQVVNLHLDVILYHVFQHTTDTHTQYTDIWFSLFL